MSEENNTNAGVEDENIQKPTMNESETNVEDTNPDAGNDGEQSQDDLAHWKRMSRKNENDYKKTAKELDKANAQLAEANMRIARMEATAKHPCVTADVLDMLCKETTPEGVAEWADMYASLNGEAAATKPVVDDKESLEKEIQRGAMLNHQAAKLSQRHDGSSMSKPSSYSSYYEEYMRAHQDDNK